MKLSVNIICMPGDRTDDLKLMTHYQKVNYHSATNTILNVSLITYMSSTTPVVYFGTIRITGVRKLG